MKVEQRGALAIVSQIFSDERGNFAETLSSERYGAARIGEAFLQDNLSPSGRQLDAGTGARHRGTPAGAAQGLGEFASPGTDGSIAAVAAGYLPESHGRSLTVKGGECIS